MQTPLRILGILLATAALAQAEDNGIQPTFDDPVRGFTILSPPGWEQYPSDELPEGIRALYYQVAKNGEATGASLAVWTFADQVHSDLDFNEFVGLHQLNVRSLGLESDDIRRAEIGAGPDMRLSLEYTLDEEGDSVWYKQVFYRLDGADVLMLSAKSLAATRQDAIQDFNTFFDSVRIQRTGPPPATPEPLDLPPLKELTTP